MIDVYSRRQKAGGRRQKEEVISDAAENLVYARARMKAR